MYEFHMIGGAKNDAEWGNANVTVTFPAPTRGPHPPGMRNGLDNKNVSLAHETGLIQAETLRLKRLDGSLGCQVIYLDSTSSGHGRFVGNLPGSFTH